MADEEAPDIPMSTAQAHALNEELVAAAVRDYLRDHPGDLAGLRGQEILA